MDPYPLRFESVFRSYIWGGRRLQTVLNKPLPDDGQDYAESWEVVDHGDDQSVVANGGLTGKTLSQLVSEHGTWLLGRHAPAPKFPLLFKFLDCNRNLSVQIHPNDEQGATLDPPDLGKTEAWFIMSAEPGSKLYAGLKSEIDEASFRAHIEAGTSDEALHQLEPQAGDCVFIPAGTMHALGEGLLVAEIQQSSNTTFRLFDWNRVDKDGNARPLHIEQGLGVVDWSRGPVGLCQPMKTEHPAVERLVQCDKFILDRIRLSGSEAFTIRGDQTCRILAVIEGAVQLAGETFERGQTTLLPAALGDVPVKAQAEAVLLDMYLP